MLGRDTDPDWASDDGLIAACRCGKSRADGHRGRERRHSRQGLDLQYPDIPAEKQREMIHEETMLRAEDIAVGVHYLPTQPRRAVVQQLTIVPRVQASE